jgi:glutathione S-transferase
MKIVSFKICPFVQRVIGVLELKQVSFEVEYISLMDKPDWFLAVYCLSRDPFPNM